MAVSVERRSDGSVSLFINGDLQFDSTDERIYHEALVLPALALAQRRRESGLRALVIGGGDGLVARELFKSSAIQHLDLVDFDSRILALAKGEFSDLNSCSMQDPRLTTHVMDAWEFVDEAVGQPKLFDLIVCDLTVAEDVDGARFHSIEWYEQLHKLLGSAGILAVNAVSPQGTPEAYWSAFNSALTSGLHVRPYHISLPSFAARSYGADWGFMLASPLAITVEEFDAKLTLAEPTYTLMDLGQVRELFCLPEELFQYQATSLPAQAGSSILLHYFRYCSRITETSGATRDALLMDVQDLVVPAPDNGANLLPPGLSAAVATCLEYNSSQENADESKREMEDRLVMSVLNLVPALQQFQTRDIVADFVRDPAAFLQSIDLHGLVASLLQRAAELPEQLVAELEVLRDHLSDWAGDYDSLLRLGQRVVTVLTVVVVLGNLLYPDSAYAKGDGGHGGAGHHDGGGRGDHGGDRGGDRGDRGGDRGDRGDRGFHGDHGAFARGGYGYGGYRGFWGHNWGGYGWARPWHGFYDNYVPPVYVGTNQWSQTNVGPDQYVDETGTSYPARQYRYNQTNVQTTVNNVSNQAQNNPPSNAPSSDADDQSNGGTNAVYKLSDGADILANGQTAIPLTDQSYLMITPSGTQVMDQTTGEPIMWLYNDPALMHQTAIEIRRQEHRLNFAIRRAQGQGGNSGANDGSDSGDAPANPAALARMQATSDQLRNALDALGPVPTDKMISDVPPPVPGAIEAFASVWMTADGKYLAIKRTNGNISYLDANGWYSDLGKTKLPEPYPTKFKNVAIAYLTTLVSDADATKSKLESDTNEGSNHIDILNRELSDYQTPDGSPTDMVDFGSRKLQRSEAIRLTQLGITRTNSKLSDLQQQIDQMPAEIELAKKELQSLNAGG